jgi:hypothetical protein
MSKDIQEPFCPPNAIKQQQKNYLNIRNCDIYF